MFGMNPLVRLLTFAAMALLALVAALPAGPEKPGLTIYCAAVLQAPMQRLAQAWQAETGTALRIQYGGSNSLLSQIELHPTGDVYIAADETYTRLAVERGWAQQPVRIARLQAVATVRAKNLPRMKALSDLLTLRVAMGNAQQSAIGRVTRASLEQQGRWADLQAAVQKRGVTKPTVGDVANDVALDAVDVGIVWDATVVQQTELVAVPLAELRDAQAFVSAAVLNSASQMAVARQFCEYLQQPDAQAIFAEFGFSSRVSPESDQR